MLPLNAIATHGCLIEHKISIASLEASDRAKLSSLADIPTKDDGNPST